MRKYSLFSALCLLLAVCSTLQAQRVQDTSLVSVTYGIPYCDVQTPGQKHAQTLCFDLYEPADSSGQMRPLVITLFGGGFVFGSRDHADMKNWCMRLAKEGFAAASIDYRVMPLGKFSNKNLVRTGYLASQDVSTAVRYFKANGDRYHIDTNRIFLLGQSAGAVAIIHALYMDEDQRPELTFAEPALSPLHTNAPIDASLSTFSVAGAVLLWGSVFSPDMIDADENTPVCMIHGTKDKILPLVEGHAFSMRHLPYVYGSQSIANRMQNLGITSYELHIFDRKRHAFYFRDLYMYHLIQSQFDDCFQVAIDFLRSHSH